MIDPVFKSDNYLLARKLLDASVTRQQAIASNIANAETPGYKRLDVAADFATQLRNKMANGESLSSSAESLEPSIVQDVHARVMRPDGNTVEVEKELLEMNKNSVEYDFLTELVSRNIKQLRMAITGRSV